MSTRIVGHLWAAVVLVAMVGFLSAASAPPAKPKDDCCSKCVCPKCGYEIPTPKAVQQAAPKPGVVRQTFEEALRDQIESRPETIRSRRILNVLDMEPGPRRDRILHRMERHAAMHLELKGEVGQIDWSSIDWAKVFDVVMKLLAALLPLLLAL